MPDLVGQPIVDDDHAAVDQAWMQMLNQTSIGNAIRPKFWGPACWKFLDCLAFSYPATPSPEQQANMAAFFHALKNVLPCYSCRRDFTKMMEDEPIERHLYSRESLTRWLNDKHNQVNHKLGSPIVPYPIYVTNFCSTNSPNTSTTIQQWPLALSHGDDLTNGALVHGSKVSSGKWIWILIIVLLSVGLFYGLSSKITKRRK